MIWIVAKREFNERLRERSFQLSSGLTLVIIVLAVVLPALLGLGGTAKYTVATDAASRPIAERAVALAGRFDAKVTISATDPDVTLRDGAIRSREEPDDTLVNLLQVANEQLQTDRRPALRVITDKPVDPDRDAKAGIAFFTIMILYGQLLTYGYWVAAGVVEEKSSRVIEVLLATIRPRDLLAGKVLGLGLLGFAQLMLLAALGLVVAAVTGRVDVDGDLVAGVALSVLWFVLGYAFYSAAFAAAGATVPRQEELQSSTTPLTLRILVSLFLGFGVQNNPDGTLAHVCAFIPTTAPVTMPGRIIMGAAPAWEIAASVAVMIAATLVLIPIAARIYAAVVLRTGTRVKLGDALRLARG
jgi:ABC-2 type transport system permease protein